MTFTESPEVIHAWGPWLNDNKTHRTGKSAAK